MNNNIPCPACGFVTLELAYNSFAICNVCGWEDDGVQLANPFSGGGANSESLFEAQQKVISTYPVSVQIAKGYKRSKFWRPLNAGEKEKLYGQAKVEDWPNNCVYWESETYWYKNL